MKASAIWKKEESGRSKVRPPHRLGHRRRRAQGYGLLVAKSYDWVDASGAACGEEARDESDQNQG